MIKYRSFQRSQTYVRAVGCRNLDQLSDRPSGTSRETSAELDECICNVIGSFVCERFAIGLVPSRQQEMDCSESYTFPTAQLAG